MAAYLGHRIGADEKTPPNFFLQKIPELVESRNLTFELRSIIFLSKFSETKQL